MPTCSSAATPRDSEMYLLALKFFFSLSFTLSFSFISGTSLFISSLGNKHRTLCFMQRYCRNGSFYRKVLTLSWRQTLHSSFCVVEITHRPSPARARLYSRIRPKPAGWPRPMSSSSVQLTSECPLGALHTGTACEVMQSYKAVITATFFAYK